MQRFCSIQPLTAAICCAMLVLPLALLTAGCGFQLVTSDLSKTVSSVHIIDDRSVTVRHILERSLEATGVALGELDSSAYVVTLGNEQLRTRNGAIAESGQYIQQELQLSIEFEISGQKEASPRDRQKLTITRLYWLNPANHVTSDRERRRLLGEMKAEVADAVVRSLRVVSRPVSM